MDALRCTLPYFECDLSGEGESRGVGERGYRENTRFGQQERDGRRIRIPGTDSEGRLWWNHNELESQSYINF